MIQISQHRTLARSEALLAVNVRGPQLNNNIMLIITNVNQDIDTTLKQDKSEGAMAPLGPIVAMPVS